MAVNASLPKGTRDLLPLDVRRREYVIGVIRRVYEAHGFDPLETPAIENLSTLTGKYGEEGDQLLFKILKRGAKAASGQCDLGLRYDLTVPLARVVAMHQNALPRFFKRYQIQPVWRADRPGKGRFREFYQCDIDVVGAGAPLPEIDLLSAVSEVFSELGFEGATIRLNDRRILRGLIDVSGIPVEKEVDAITAIDKIDKIGRDGVARELDQRGVDADAAQVLLTTLATLAESATPLDALGALFEAHVEGQEAVEGLRAILEGLDAAGVPSAQLKVDPYLARGLGYYTGAIFEVSVADLAGSLAGGGRYDGLIGIFRGQSLPACGVSLGLERILVVMAERGMLPDDRSRCDVMIANFSRRALGSTLELATTLRAAGLRVDLYPQKDRLGKQFKYANARSMPFVVVIGPDEMNQGEVKIKDMQSGEQQMLPREALTAFLLEARDR